WGLPLLSHHTPTASLKSPVPQAELCANLDLSSHGCALFYGLSRIFAIIHPGIVVFSRINLGMESNQAESLAPIQLFVPTFRIDETLAAIQECLEKGWTGLGFKTIQFENAWKEYTGLPHAHFLNSATAGLHLAVAQLKAHYGWADDDEIITTPLTFVSTSHV